LTEFSVSYNLFALFQHFEINDPSYLSQNEIIEGCVRKDSICQKLLYYNYKDAMFTLCVRLCGCKTEAQDVFQEGFMDVFSSISAFRNEATIGAWMKTIFTRKAYKTYRKKLWIEDIDELNENDLIDWGSEINTEHL
jgi:RNA polymerase sigma-70 factor (ECF subfamily)